MRISARLLLVLSAAWGWAQGPVWAEGLRFQSTPSGFAAHGAAYDAWVSNDGAIVTPAGRLKLLGADSAKGVWASSEVFYRGIYPGIDLVYYSHGGRLEYDFVVAPGGDPGRIVFAMDGAALEIGAGGELRARTTAGEMRLDPPFIYQAGPDGIRQAIRGGYAVDGDHVSFRIGDYDRSKPLTIDPVLSYATFVGQNGDGVSAATADSSGNAYLVGKASGVILVEKVSPAGAILLRQTIGTTPYNFNAEAVAVTSAGAVYITGTSDAGLPTTANAYLGSVTSGNHAFIVVLNPSLAPTYCSYIAGTGSAGDQANGIAVDATGNAYITGLTDSSTFPVTAGAYQSTGSTNGQTGFVSKINPSASGAASLVYSTYLGGPTTATATRFEFPNLLWAPTPSPAAAANNSAISIIGGGSLQRAPLRRLAQRLRHHHISTGGAIFQFLLEGRSSPGVEALTQKYYLRNTSPAFQQKTKQMRTRCRSTS